MQLEQNAKWALQRACHMTLHAIAQIGDDCIASYTTPQGTTIPPGVGPYVRLVFAEILRQGRAYDAVEITNSVLRSTMAWRKSDPGPASIETVLNSLGWRLTPPSWRRYLPISADDVGSPAARMCAEIPAVWTA